MSSLHSDEDQEEINVDTDSRLSAGCDQSDRESDRERSESYSPRMRHDGHSMSPDLHRSHLTNSQTHPTQISLPFSISRLLGKSFDDEKGLVSVARRGVNDLIDRIQRRDSNEDTTDEEGRLRSDNDNDNESDGAREEYRRVRFSVDNEVDPDGTRDEYRKLRESAGGCLGANSGGGNLGYGVGGAGLGGGVLRVPAQRALGALGGLGALGPLGPLPWGLPLDPRHAAAAAFAHHVVKDRLNGNYFYPVLEPIDFVQ